MALASMGTRRTAAIGAALAMTTMGLALLPALPTSAASSTELRALHDPPVTSIPLAGSQTAAAGTTITIAGVAPAEIGSVAVRGSVSGPVPGTTTVLPGGNGLVFDPTTDLVEGEQVSVSSDVEVRGGEGGTFSFVVGRSAVVLGAGRDADPDLAGLAPTAPAATTAASTALTSRPDLRPSPVTVSTPSNGAAPGDLFAAPRATDTSDQGIQIYDPAGHLIWFHPVTTPNLVSGNAFVDSYLGTPALFWFEGTSPFGPGSNRGEWIAVDQSYRELGRIRMGNGYRADVHELFLTGRGTAYLEAYHPLVCTGSGVLTDCIKDAPVLDAVVQEVDLATGAVLWEWHALDHIPLSDSYITGTAEFFDYIHLNSIAEDGDGDVLISGRHTSALYKVDKATGELLWTFGGKHPSLTTVVGEPSPISGPDYPHHLRPLGGGDYTYFDNGNRRGHSRAATFHVDVPSKTATFTRIVRHEPEQHQTSQGAVQALPGGDQLVSWGGSGMATEYDGSGATRFEATIAGGTYRTYRFDWTGAPATKPDLVASGTGPNVTLSVSWNGDDRTANWRFSSGDTAGSLTPAKTVARTDFEVSTTIPRRAYAVAQALDAEGRVIGQSAPVPTGGPFREVAVPPVDGSYRPIVGDFAGSRNDDVVYYRPGSGADYLHISDGDGGFRSIVLPPISGDYETLVGDFVGDDRDDIVFYRRGSAVAYLWRLDGEDRGQDVAVTSAAMLVPTKVTKALVLDNRAPYGGPRDEILWYAAGRSPDRIDHLGWPSDGPLTMTSRAITVNGTFQPVAGDFDGNGFADVFWYAPGPATDHLWFLSGTETRSRSQTSVPAPVRGTYTPLVGNLVGSADNLELAFIAPGPGADSVWTFGASGAHASRDVTTSLNGTPLVLQGTPDRMLLWVPGFAPWVESIDPFGTQPVGGSSFDARYRPLVGDFTGAGGTASILWYAPGSAPERLSRAD